MAEQKRDIVPIVALGVGGVAVAAGLYFYTKKEKGVDPGDVITAMFAFDYHGDGGTYVLQVGLGHLRFGIFDNVEGLRFRTEVDLPKPEVKPDHYEYLINIEIPIGTDSGTYDAEAIIRTPAMDLDDKIVRVRTEGAVVVRKA